MAVTPGLGEHKVPNQVEVPPRGSLFVEGQGGSVSNAPGESLLLLWI